jgi:hypothetical protein
MTGASRHRSVSMRLVLGAAFIASCGSDPAVRSDGGPDPPCPEGALLITDVGWGSDGTYTTSLPGHTGSHSYVIGRSHRNGPSGERDYLVAAVLLEPASPSWVLKIIAKESVAHTGSLDASEILCLDSFDAGVRWLDIGREKDITTGPFVLSPIVQNGKVIDIRGTRHADHFLLKANASGSHVHGGAGRDVLVDDTAGGAFLYGDEDSDVLVGNASGLSTLYGGPGDDRLSGSHPSNRYHGGAGDDCIVPARMADPTVTAAVIDGGEGTNASNFSSDGLKVINVTDHLRNTLAGYWRCGQSVIDLDGQDPWPHGIAEAGLADVLARARSSRLSVDVAPDAFVHASPDGVLPGAGSCPAGGGKPACAFPIACVDAGCSGVIRARGLDEAARMRVTDKAGYAPWFSPRFAGWSSLGPPNWTDTQWPGIADCQGMGGDDNDGDGVPDLHDNPDNDFWDVAALRVGAAARGFVTELTTCGAGPDGLSAFERFLGSRPHCLYLFDLTDECTPAPGHRRHYGIGYHPQSETGTATVRQTLPTVRHWWIILIANQDEW